jgi:hypothetical protein
MPTASVLGMSALLSAVVLHTRRASLATRHVSDDTRLRVELLTTWSIAIFTWVALFDGVVGIRDAIRAPWLLMALAWPIALLAGEMHCIEHQTLDFLARRSSSTLQIESNAISGLAFALGGLLASNLGTGLSKSAAPMLSVVLFLCVAFVLPSPSIQPRSPMGATVHAVQRACLTYCIGFLLAAVITNVQGTWHRRLCFAPGTGVSAPPTAAAVAPMLAPPPPAPARPPRVGARPPRAPAGLMGSLAGLGLGMGIIDAPPPGPMGTP